MVVCDNRCLANWATVVCPKEELFTHWISLYSSYSQYVSRDWPTRSASHLEHFDQYRLLGRDETACRLLRILKKEGGGEGEKKNTHFKHFDRYGLFGCDETSYGFL